MKTRNKFFVVLSVVIFLLSALLWVPKLFGMSSYYVSSDSMKPEISKGSLAFSKQVDFEDIVVGEDVLVFTSSVNSRTFMHRVVYINEAEQLIFTKGDNNNAADPLPAEYSACKGRVVFHVPFVGYFAWALDTLVGKIAVIAFYIICAALLIEGRRVSKSKKEVDAK